MTRIYVLVSVEMLRREDFTVDPVGVYTNMEEAIKYAVELEDAFKDVSDVMFDVLEFDLDEKPPLLEILKKQRQMLEDNVESVLIRLMKKGVIDQLIDEDGNFCYVLTDEGKKMKNFLPEKIRKMFRDKDEK